MADTSFISRRKAAIAIAGTLVTSVGPVAAAALRADVDVTAASSGRRVVEDHHRNIVRLLRNVRQARLPAARVKAFDQCKAALRLHEWAESPLATSAGAEGGKRYRSTGLYRYTDPAHVLIGVIVRELDAVRSPDAEWMQRFEQLEIAFQTHVAES